MREVAEIGPVRRMWLWHDIRDEEEHRGQAQGIRSAILGQQRPLWARALSYVPRPIEPRPRCNGVGHQQMDTGAGYEKKPDTSPAEP